MNLKVCMVLCVLAIFWTNAAARDLQAELSDMVPSGKVIRLAYVKGGPPQNFNNAENAAVYVVSSEDGIIRKIYPAGTAIGNYECVNMTDDGTRVVFYDRGRGEVVVVNYDGTLINAFSADRLVDYWIDPQDESEWAVVTTGSAIQRISLINPNNEVAVTTMPLPNYIYIDAGLCTGISDDGNKIMAVYEGGPDPVSIGLLNVSTNEYTAGGEGCWPQMRSGTPIQFSQNFGIYRHRGPQIFNEDGSQDQWISTTAAMDDFFQANPTLDASATECFPEEGHASDGHRWLRDRNYLTFTCQRSKVNPILWRVSDGKFMYIEDDLSCIFAGDMEGVVGTFPPVGTLPERMHRRGHAQQAAGPWTYSVDGRLLPRHARADQAISGIIIRQSADGTMTRVFR